MTLERY